MSIGVPAEAAAPPAGASSTALQRAPVSRRKAATAASTVGKKWAGSIVRVEPVALDLAPDRVLELGEDQADAALR